MGGVLVRSVSDEVMWSLWSLRGPVEDRVGQRVRCRGEEQVWIRVSYRVAAVKSSVREHLREGFA